MNLSEINFKHHFFTAFFLIALSFINIKSIAQIAAPPVATTPGSIPICIGGGGVTLSDIVLRETDNQAFGNNQLWVFT